MSKYEPSREELEAFITRAGFRWGWENLESAARRMAEHACIELQAAHLAAQAEWPSDGRSRMSDELRFRIEGMSVSFDVGTCDEDAGNRYFGTVTEVMDDRNGKHGVTLLVQDAKPNFVADQVTNDAIEALRDVDAVVTRWRETGRETAYHQWLTLQDIVRAALQSARPPATNSTEVSRKVVDAESMRPPVGLVSDEDLRKACRAAYPDWEKFTQAERESLKKDTRAALESYASRHAPIKE